MKHFNLKTAFFLLFSILILPAFSHFGTRGPFAGTISCITEHNGIVYLGTEKGGVFESTTNLLVAWRARPVGLHSGKISAICHSGSYLFAGTADSGVYIFNGYVGSDRYWNPINTGLTNLKITSLISIDSITILAGTAGGGLYRTTDKGANWAKIINPSLNSATITSLAKSANRIFLCSQGGGVFMSDDNGVTWSGFNDLNTLNVNGTNELSYNSTTDELMVLNNSGLFIAAAVSVTFSPVYNSAFGNLPFGTVINGISTNGSNWYLATGVGIYLNIAPGFNWSQINSGLPSGEATGILALSSVLVCGIKHYGVYKSATGTIVWDINNTNFSNPPTHSFTTDGDSFIATATDRGIFISKNLGLNYTLSNNGLTDSTNITDVVKSSDKIYVSTKNAGVFYSSDMGVNWYTFNDGLVNLYITRIYSYFSSLYAFDSDGKVLERKESSGSWVQIGNELPVNTAPSSLCFYGTKMLLGTLGDGVFIKELDSTEWKSFNTGLGSADITSVTASAGKFFAGTMGQGVFVSDAGSASWSPANPAVISHATLLNIESDEIQAIAAHNGYVYASYKGGLVATSDAGNSWIPGGNQFNLPTFTNVHKIDFVNSRVFVSTENNAIYSNALSELPILPDTVLVVSADTLYFPIQGDTFPVHVTCNTPFDIVASKTWTNFSPSVNSGNAVISVGQIENFGGPRSSVISFISGVAPNAHIKDVYLFQDGKVGIDEVVANRIGDWLLFPNPNSGLITVYYKHVKARVKSIAIHDMCGKQIEFTVTGEGQYQLNISTSAPAGVYSVILKTDKGMLAKKLIIQ